MWVIQWESLHNSPQRNIWFQFFSVQMIIWLDYSDLNDLRNFLLISLPVWPPKQKILPTHKITTLVLENFLCMFKIIIYTSNYVAPIFPHFLPCKFLLIELPVERRNVGPFLTFSVYLKTVFRISNIRTDDRKCIISIFRLLNNSEAKLKKIFKIQLVLLHYIKDRGIGLMNSYWYAIIMTPRSNLRHLGSERAKLCWLNTILILVVNGKKWLSYFG